VDSLEDGHLEAPPSCDQTVWTVHSGDASLLLGGAGSE
jgi:hypothetical protein